jgi:putative SOS response-associated peptidase YedK
MCGRFNTTFDSGVKKLYTSLNIHKVIDKPIDSRFVKAADTVSIVRNVGGQRRLENATWWLLLEQSNNDFKPSRYTSFNTRFDKLNTPGSAGYQAYRSSRCIIAVKGFGETEFVNKKPVHYFDMEAESGGLILGGLYREWQHQATGEIKLSCSVITLPPHEKLKHIHSKAMPLMLPQESSLIDQWLSPQVNGIEQFDSLLHPFLPKNLIANRIDKPMTHQVISESQTISRDF